MGNSRAALAQILIKRFSSNDELSIAPLAQIDYSHVNWTIPALLLDENPVFGLEVASNALQSRPGQEFQIDAGQLLCLQPVSACLLGVTATRMHRNGARLSIRSMPRDGKKILQDFDAPVTWFDGQGLNPETQPPTIAIPVTDRNSANEAAERISASIAKFVPREDQAGMEQDSYSSELYDRIQPVVFYIFSELVDNVFSHARISGTENAQAWLAAQYYASGDLVRVAVVDDGCGLRASLRDIDESPPKNHVEAVQRAFTPFVTSKGTQVIYQDNRHMGMGLTVCRDICVQSQGRIYAMTGNARVNNPGLTGESAAQLQTPFDGTIIAVELHRRNVTVGMTRTIVAGYTKGSGDLPLRFG
jgi:hypothetical protein